MRQRIRISMRDCVVGSPPAPALSGLSWELRSGEVWIVTGPNGGGKSAFAAALAGAIPVSPAEGGEYRNAFAGAAALVSFEEAAALLVRERANDDSDYVEGGVDQGTTARVFIEETMPRRASPLRLEEHPAVVSCGVAPFLDRGLKRLSTGEIRRTLLARALAAEPSLLVLDEPYEGLDSASRAVLADILEKLAAGSAAESGAEVGPLLVLVADRWEHIPAAANRVVELRDRKISFSGARADYELQAAGRRRAEVEKAAAERDAMTAGLNAAGDEAAGFARPETSETEAYDGETLVEFRSVTVGWSGRKVLDRMDWKVRRGEHWLIRGPNGSGKTTILELITGDNPQVFSNDVRLFGSLRGSGETIWELKRRMGIVSYRLHLEYRYMDDASLEEVLVSGLHDSIGLYRSVGDAERLLARRWLDLAGFSGRADERFGRLSFGEQRAVLAARGAIKGPELLILDEPCHGLDEAHRDRLLALLEAIAERGQSTLLYVTHDPAEMLGCVRNVLELRPGCDPMWAVISPRVVL